MNIQFATCDRQRALLFLSKLYPSRTVTDTPESAKPLLDLVERDIVRIQDPDCHPLAQVVPGTHWEESKRAEIFAVCQAFHDAPTEEVGK